MSGFRRRYGSNPLHLLVTLASFAFAGGVIVQVFEATGPWSFVLWFVGAAIAHDLVAYPLYTLADRIALRTTRPAGSRPPVVPAINYLRVPGIISGLLFVVWFPFILGLSDDTYMATSGRSTEAFLPRWLAITGALFAVSAALYTIRVRRARRIERGAPGGG